MDVKLFSFASDFDVFVLFTRSSYLRKYLVDGKTYSLWNCKRCIYVGSKGTLICKTVA